MVTLEEVKSFLGISDDQYDAFITFQINLISESIELFCRRKFEITDYAQTFYRNDYARFNNLGGDITLYNYPVNSIDSVEIDDIEVDPSEYRFTKNGYLTRGDGRHWAALADDKIKVFYNAGFSEIPYNIKNTIFSIVGENLNKKKSGIDINFGSDVQRVSIPGVMSIDFDYTLQNNDIKNRLGLILGNYVNTLTPFRTERALIGQNELIYES